MSEPTEREWLEGLRPEDQERGVMVSDPQAAAKRILNAVMGDEDAIAVARAYQEAIEALELMYRHGGGAGSDDYNAVKWTEGRDKARRVLASAATPTKENA